MSIQLPPDVEAIAAQKAALAGLPDVDTFVRRLIENAAPEPALLPPPSDPRILAAISEGIAAGEMDEAFWIERSKRLEGQINAPTISHKLDR
jgi:hypothetical protein